MLAVVMAARVHGKRPLYRRRRLPWIKAHSASMGEAGCRAGSGPVKGDAVPEYSWVLVRSCCWCRRRVGSGVGLRKEASAIMSGAACCCADDVRGRIWIIRKSVLIGFQASVSVLVAAAGACRRGPYQKCRDPVCARRAWAMRNRSVKRTFCHRVRCSCPEVVTQRAGWPPAPAWPAHAERDVLGHEQAFVEATRGLERGAGAEDEAARSDAEHAEQHDRRGFEQADVERQRAHEAHGGAAAHGAGIERLHRCLDGLPVHQGVGIDEQHPVATGGGCTGIARGCDVAHVHLHHACPASARDRRGGVGRGIIHHDHVHPGAECAGGNRDSVERGANDRSLVVRGNDDGQHACSGSSLQWDSG